MGRRAKTFFAAKNKAKAQCWEYQYRLKEDFAENRYQALKEAEVSGELLGKQSSPIGGWLDGLMAGRALVKATNVMFVITIFI